MPELQTKVRKTVDTTHRVQRPYGCFARDQEKIKNGSANCTHSQQSRLASVKNSESCRILSHTFHRRPITIRITAWNAVQSFCNQYAFGILKKPVFSRLCGLRNTVFTYSHSTNSYIWNSIFSLSTDSSPIFLTTLYLLFVFEEFLSIKTVSPFHCDPLPNSLDLQQYKPHSKICKNSSVVPLLYHVLQFFTRVNFSKIVFRNTEGIF